jgi:sarcosine oxidase subunit beta
MTGATADVVIIGAGVNGLSTAFRLAQQGAGRIVVVERTHVAGGASGKSGALVRMHYSNAPESELAQKSLRVFQEWAEVVGGDCGWNPTGFLRIARPEHEAALRANVAVQQDLGINTRLVSAAEVQELAPMIRTDDFTFGAWEPDSGYADPVATTYGFARRAAELGVAIRTNTPVTAITTASGRVTGVELAGGERIAAPVVLLTGGAWANALLAPLGLDFGLVPHRIQVAVFHWSPELIGHPVIIDAFQSSWLRQEGAAGTLIGVELGDDAADPDAFTEAVDAAQIERCRRALVARIPAMAGTPMRGAWAGLIMMSPDGRPILDQLPQYEGLFCIVGDSGTSFKTSPAIGQAMAEWIVAGEPRLVDLAPFSAARFAAPRPWLHEHRYGAEEDTATISR